MDHNQKSMLMCALVIVLILFLILGGPAKYLGYERFASSSAANRACALCATHPLGRACAQCKNRAGGSDTMRTLREAGACRHACATSWESQSCKACRARGEHLSDPGPCTNQCLGQGVNQLDSATCAACISSHPSSAMLGLME